MNIECIKKYKKEFDHCVDGGSIIVVFNNGGWVDEKSFNWSEEGQNSVVRYIIINDEYVELRRALAEGKILQLNEAEKFGDPKRGWVDLSCTDLGHSRVLFPVEYYRIKPEESKRNTFKVGDWVNVPALDSVPCQFSEDLCCLGLALWKPQVGEVHWFARNKDEDPVLGKFVEMITYKCKNQYIVITSPDVSFTCSYFEYCEPFIGTLPTKWRNK